MQNLISDARADPLGTEVVKSPFVSRRQYRKIHMRSLMEISILDAMGRLCISIIVSCRVDAIAVQFAERVAITSSMGPARKTA